MSLSKVRNIITDGFYTLTGDIFISNLCNQTTTYICTYVSLNKYLGHTYVVIEGR